MGEEHKSLSRCWFLQTSALSSAIGLPGTAASRGAQGSGYHVVLKGGHFIDPANQIDGLMDAAVAGDKISAARPGIPVECVRSGGVTARMVAGGALLFEHSPGAGRLGQGRIFPAL